MTGEGPTVTSFPVNKAVDYKKHLDHFMLISRAISGRNFNLTLTFIDIEPEKEYYRGLFIQDNAEKTMFISKWL